MFFRGSESHFDDAIVPAFRRSDLSNRSSKPRYRRFVAVLLAAGITTFQPAVESAAAAEPGSEKRAAIATHPLPFNVQLLTVDSNEGIAAADIDGDGKTDMVAGRNWFRNPTGRLVRCGTSKIGMGSQSNGDYIWTSTRTGDRHRRRIVSSDRSAVVREPGKEGLRLGKSGPLTSWWTPESTNEGQLLEDIDGDGGANGSSTAGERMCR